MSVMLLNRKVLNGYGAVIQSHITVEGGSACDGCEVHAAAPFKRNGHVYVYKEVLSCQIYINVSKYIVTS